MSDNLEERLERIEDELGMEHTEGYILEAYAPPDAGGARYYEINEELRITTTDFNRDEFVATVKGDRVFSTFSDKWNVSEINIVPRSEAE